MITGEPPCRRIRTERWGNHRLAQHDLLSDKLALKLPGPGFTPGPDYAMLPLWGPLGTSAGSRRRSPRRHLAVKRWDAVSYEHRCSPGPRTAPDPRRAAAGERRSQASNHGAARRRHRADGAGHAARSPHPERQVCWTSPTPDRVVGKLYTFSPFTATCRRTLRQATAKPLLSLMRNNLAF